MHDAVLYADDRHLVEAAVVHLREGAARGEQLVLACTEERNQMILAAAGDLPPVQVMAECDTYGSPVEALEFYVIATEAAVAAGATGLRVVGALPEWTLQAPRTWPRWSRYEAAVNHVFQDLPFQGLCTYDTRVTDPKLLRAVRATHPHLRHRHLRAPNPDYRDPAELLEAWSAPPVLPVEARKPLVEVGDIARAGDVARVGLMVADVLFHLDTALQPYAELLPPADPDLIEVEDYLRAVDEVLINAVVHGTGPATLRLWVEHDHVVITVSDGGAGVTDPFLGFTTALDPVSGSRQQGLWFARQFCDDLTFRHDDAGFTVRLRADLDVRSDELG